MAIATRTVCRGALAGAGPGREASAIPPKAQNQA